MHFSVGIVCFRLLFLQCRSQIIRRREILVLYKSLILAGYIVHVAFEHAKFFFNNFFTVLTWVTVATLLAYYNEVKRMPMGLKIMGWLTHRLQYCRYTESNIPNISNLSDAHERLARRWLWDERVIKPLFLNQKWELSYCTHILTMNERRTCSK